MVLHETADYSMNRDQVSHNSNDTFNLNADSSVDSKVAERTKRDIFIDSCIFACNSVSLQIKLTFICVLAYIELSFLFAGDFDITSELNMYRELANLPSHFDLHLFERTIRNG